MHTNNISQRIIFLDYLRVFAFMSVLVGHIFYPDLEHWVAQFPTPHITQQYIANLFLSIFAGGGAGVMIFFMISGYIILHVLQKERPVEFLIKRIFRIYPLLIFAISVQVVLAFFVKHKPFDLSTTLLQMSLMGDFFNTPNALNGVDWSLRVEILFYLFMFVLSFTFLIRKHGYIFFFLLVFLTIAMKHIPPLPSEHFIGFFNIYAPFLFLGSIIYMYEKKHINLIALLAFIFILFHFFIWAEVLYEPDWINSNYGIVGFAVFMLLWLTRKHLHAVPMIINRSITAMALLTYSVYLFHNFMWDYIDNALKAVGIHSEIAVFLVLLIWCIFMYKLVEKPLYNYGKTLAVKYTTKRERS